MAGWFDRTIRDFLAAAASDAPTPGGGSVAALGGALAASMVCMVAALTLKKLPAGDERAALETIYARGRALLEAFEDLAEEDMAAFAGLMQAYRLPRASEEESRRRAQAVQDALARATRVPLETAGRCVATLELALEAARRGSRNAVSDAGVAANLAAGALEAALINVDINVVSLTDPGLREEAWRERERLRRLGEDLQAEVRRVVAGRIGETG